MCGRYTLDITLELLTEVFGVTEIPPEMPEPAARHNIAPTQPVLVVRAAARGGGRQLAHVVWGLIPPWAADPGMGARMINARAETAAEKPSFRTPLRRRRCLVPATGFYEWRKTGGGTKQPFLVRMRGGAPFAMAGIWEMWRGAGDSELESCAILTTGANALMRPVHDRMPVILRPEDFGLWLDPLVDDPRAVQGLLRPAEPEAMELFAVSTLVNNPRHDLPECVRPAAEDA